jgi:hypothetical protein
MEIQTVVLPYKDFIPCDHNETASWPLNHISLFIKLLWSFGLRHRVVLLVDVKVSEKHLYMKTGSRHFSHMSELSYRNGRYHDREDQNMNLHTCESLQCSTSFQRCFHLLFRFIYVISKTILQQWKQESVPFVYVDGDEIQDFTKKNGFIQ